MTTVTAHKYIYSATQNMDSVEDMATSGTSIELASGTEC